MLYMLSTAMTKNTKLKFCYYLVLLKRLVEFKYAELFYPTALW